MIEEKKKLDVEREKQRVKEQIQKTKLEELLEREKKDIIQEYAGLIREIEAEELYSQKQEIEDYKRELQLKMAEERQVRRSIYQMFELGYRHLYLLENKKNQ